MIRHPPSPTGISPGRAADGADARRVLVVDDDDAGADSLADLLRALGHEVQVAYCAEDALASARAFLPDVIFLDLDMPRLNGIEAAHCLSKDFLCRRATLVALTGRRDPSARVLTREAGCHLHLEKPVDVEALKAALAFEAH